MTSFDCLPGLGVFHEVCNTYSGHLSRIAFRFESCALCLAHPGAVAYVLCCKNLEVSIYGNYFLQKTLESVVWHRTNKSTKFERSWIQSMQVSEHLVWISFSASPRGEHQILGRYRGPNPLKCMAATFDILSRYLHISSNHFAYILLTSYLMSQNDVIPKP